jgi:ribose transport system permease protein
MAKVAGSMMLKILGIKKNVQRYAPLILFVILFLVLSIYNSNFISTQSMYNLMMQVSYLGVVALGAMVTLISGGIDFTAGYGMSLAGVSAGALYVASGGNGLILIVSSIVIGGLVGLVNGMIITKLRLHPFIVTLAMMSVCQGLSTMVAEGQKIVIQTDYLLALGSGKIFGVIPACFVVFLVIAFIMWLIMNRTSIGVYIYAMGGNEDAVVYSGINDNFYKVIVYIIAGLCYGIAAILSVTQVTVITPNISGTVLLDGIASAVVGGTSLAGGRGTVLGVIIGTFIITLISTLLTFFGVSPLLRDAMKGLIIIGVLLFDTVLNRLSKRQHSIQSMMH